MLAYVPRPRRVPSPSTLTLVVALHGAGLAALMLAGPELILPADPVDTEITFIDSAPPEPLPPEPVPQPETPRTTAEPTFVEPLVKLPVEGPTIPTDRILDLLPLPIDPVAGDPVAGVVDVPAPPTRTGARLATPTSRLRPDYPVSKRRLGEEATLRLRLSIDAVGRVTSVVPLGSYDPVFFAAAEEHILKAWRYTPATLGDDAVPDEKVVTLSFELDD